MRFGQAYHERITIIIGSVISRQDTCFARRVMHVQSIGLHPIYRTLGLYRSRSYRSSFLIRVVILNGYGGVIESLVEGKRIYTRVISSAVAFAKGEGFRREVHVVCRSAGGRVFLVVGSRERDVHIARIDIIQRG